jgi:hypothetical protein
VPERAFHHRPASRSWLSGLAWSRALGQAKSPPGGLLSAALAERLIQAWGDETTAVSPEYLVHCHRAASFATGTIIDFGAGVTTIVMALACRNRPASVFAFEHDPVRRIRVLAELSQLCRRGADVRLVALDRREGIAWPRAELHAVRRPLAFAAMHPIGGLSPPREAWDRIVEPALPDKCPVYFDPPDPEKANGVPRTGP